MLKITHQRMQEMITSRPVVNEQELGYSLYHTTFTSVIDEPICKGATRSVCIREGITFMEVELVFMQDTEVEMMSTQPQVGFGFCLKGQSTAYVRGLYNHEGADFAMHLSERTTYIYANDNSSGYQHFWAGNTFKGLYIHFSYDSFRELVAGSLEELPSELVSALDRSQNSYLYFSSLPLAVLSLCYALLDNPFKGKSREFYTEAKVMELIAYQVDALLNPEATAKRIAPPLTPQEEQKIDHCYRMLQQSLSDPPSLLELAKTSGMSVYRLKNGFRQRYGDTPFRLLTELRMLRAKEMLEAGVWNVSEVALEVGYISLGTFSNTFHERFGLRPSAIKK